MYWPGNVSPPVFNNDSGATFLKSGGAGTTTLSSVTFNNAGTLELQSGSLVINSAFNQTGTCSVEEGLLSLQGGGTCQGNFDVPISSSLQFGGGGFTFGSNIVFSGPGLAGSPTRASL